MKYALYLFVITLFSSCDIGNKYAAQKTLSPTEQDTLLWKVIRYVGHSPKGATHQDKWDARFDAHYRKEITAKEYSIPFYYIDKTTGKHYFTIQRIAPSKKRKFVITAGTLKYDEAGKITEYEEVFRTWKMEEEELHRKTLILFEKMIKGEDLSSYYPQNSEEEWIEFPDKLNYYDKETRQWKVKNP
jgi:hypothetical protein